MGVLETLKLEKPTTVFSLFGANYCFTSDETTRRKFTLYKISIGTKDVEKKCPFRMKKKILLAFCQLRIHINTIAADALSSRSAMDRGDSRRVTLAKASHVIIVSV